MVSDRNLLLFEFNIIFQIFERKKMILKITNIILEYLTGAIYRVLMSLMIYRFKYIWTVIIVFP